MKISIICPLYNGEQYIEKLHESILKQKVKCAKLDEILYALTKSTDNSEQILQKLGANYTLIEPEEFSHSRTREMMAEKCNGDIIVFISQDIRIKNNDWLNNLVEPIVNGQSDASFSRQIGCDETIEKYTREINYPEKSRIVSRDDIPEYEIRTFFYSDASSAVNRRIYKELKGYDGKILPTNEDMYFAYKLIHSGYKIKYCANSEVYHSHVFTYKQLYKRYYDTGVFFKANPYFLNYKSTQSGLQMAKYVFKRSIQDRNIKVFFQVLPNFAIRFIAKYMGEHER